MIKKNFAIINWNLDTVALPMQLYANTGQEQYPEAAEVILKIKESAANNPTKYQGK